MNVVLKPAAKADIADYIDYLFDEFAYDAADRFPLAVGAAIDFVQNNPDAGAPFAAFRSWPLPGFPHVRLYYSPPNGENLYIARVLHSARDIDSILESEYK